MWLLARKNKNKVYFPKCRTLPIKFEVFRDLLVMAYSYTVVLLYSCKEPAHFFHLCVGNIRKILQCSRWLYCIRGKKYRFSAGSFGLHQTLSLSGVWAVLSPTKTCWNWWYSAVREDKEKNVACFYKIRIFHTVENRGLFGCLIIMVMCCFQSKWWHLWATGIFIF